MKTYSGRITVLKPNQVFVFGSNPEGRHGAGAAKVAMQFGAKYGCGRGLQGLTYALVTKNLTMGFLERSTGIRYNISGPRSVSEEQIIYNISELYNVARQNADKEFLIAYSGNGTNLNGYSAVEMAKMFAAIDIPSNIIFEESFARLVRDNLFV